MGKETLLKEDLLSPYILAAYIQKRAEGIMEAAERDRKGANIFAQMS